jgi:ketosteroid isomerase-like protein
MERAASNYRDGEIIGFEKVAKFVSSDLACIVEVERYRAKVGGSEDITPVSLRVTSILRAEDGTWKIVHRHADPISTPQPAESVIQE